MSRDLIEYLSQPTIIEGRNNDWYLECVSTEDFRQDLQEYIQLKIEEFYKRSNKVCFACDGSILGTRNFCDQCGRKLPAE